VEKGSYVKSQPVGCDPFGNCRSRIHMSLIKLMFRKAKQSFLPVPVFLRAGQNPFFSGVNAVL
jgi:hypothetical protein